jgi:hypothetical protein
VCGLLQMKAGLVLESPVQKLELSRLSLCSSGGLLALAH